MVARAAAVEPFAGAADLLADLAGIRLSTKRVERSAEADGQAAAAALTVQSRQILAGGVSVLAPAQAPDMLYIEVDGTGVPVVAAAAADRAGKGEDGRARTREVKLACLFTQTRTDELGDDQHTWLAARLTDLDNGDIEALVRATRALPLTGADAEQTETALDYFIKNAQRMRYAVFRDLGMFIGSGVVEAGCKSLVGQRLKLSGMRWNIPGATGILTLRCHRESNRWEQIWPQPNNQISPAAGRHLAPVPAATAA
jgi:hypothetical protein